MPGDKSDKSDKSDRTGKSANPAKARPLGKADYLERLKPLQLRLNALARWVAHGGERVVVVLEGRDTAGKGGAANAIAETLNPRQCRVVALGKPDERERGQWYFQRYVPHLPAAGEIVVFDRSWYNRAGVERVMGYCTEAQAKDFLAHAPAFERLLVDDGVRLLKYWLTVDQVEQERRFAERLADPMKRWKLSPVDVLARTRYADYGRARNAMLKATHTPSAPWTLVDFNDQRLGRLTLIDHLLGQLPVTPVADAPLVFAPLPQAPQRERYLGSQRPIAPFKIDR